ncbi:Uu.00g006890.m01.CDS01 [Anthostomella pinea]|uniref:Uu.00g006890.m01.CDS01 n=1 Tax=Anthostomella pinea TaxID=933095 RepID=A0AAI8VKF1_9PEZI|nr:Uu.00g006890.m01.CDS01 [Anthostomella pinea]
MVGQRPSSDNAKEFKLSIPTGELIVQLCLPLTQAVVDMVDPLFDLRASLVLRKPVPRLYKNAVDLPSHPFHAWSLEWQLLSASSNSSSSDWYSDALVASIFAHISRSSAVVPASVKSFEKDGSVAPLTSTSYRCTLSANLVSKTSHHF